jgi:homoserine dehydrogenase
MYSGPGAGGDATASAVLADVIAIAQQGSAEITPRNFDLQQQTPILPIEQARSAHYVRIPTRDEPGVFAQVANALSRHEISIEAAIQKQPRTSKDLVAIVMLTQVTTEKDIVAALAQVSELPQVTGNIARIRVETLE